MSPGRPLRAASIALGVALLGAGPALAKDDLVIGLAQFPNSLHPDIGSQTVQQYALGFALRPLTSYDPRGEIVCLLCTEVPTLANGLARVEKQPDGSDGLAVTFKLLPDLHWGDGVPVTARDLAFTWKLGSDPRSGFANTHPWTRARRVDVVDDHTAVLHLDRTLTSYNLWDEILPEHVEGPVLAAAEGPADYVNHTLYNRAPLTPGLWDGPFIVSGYASNAQITFTPNPYWTGHKPGLARIALRLLENTAALQANLLSGDVDMTPSGIGLSIDQAVNLQAQHADRFVFDYKPQLVYEHIDVQYSNPVLRDRRVREALLRAIDLPTLVRKLFGGHAEIARSFINGLDRHYVADVPTYPYDPAKARALLAEAGWTPGADGICRNPAGDRLSFEFNTTSGNRIRELTQQVMQSQWKAVGIEATIRNQPSRSFFGELLKKREFTGMMEFSSSYEVDLVPWSRLGSAYIPSEANNWGGQNYAGISDPQLDADIAQAQTELDPGRQQALWTDMQRIYAGKLLALPLYFREDPDVLPTWLGGYVATGKELQASYTAEDWSPK